VDSVSGSPPTSIAVGSGLDPSVGQRTAKRRSRGSWAKEGDKEPARLIIRNQLLQLRLSSRALSKLIGKILEITKLKNTNKVEQALYSTP